MYLDFTYFAKQDSDWLSISSLISMFGYRGGLDGEERRGERGGVRD